MARTTRLHRRVQAWLEREVEWAWRKPSVAHSGDVERELRATAGRLLEHYEANCPDAATRHRFYLRHRPAGLPSLTPWRSGDELVDQVIDLIPNEVRGEMALDRHMALDRDLARRQVRTILESVHAGRFAPGRPEDREVEKEVLVASVEARVAPPAQLRAALKQVSKDLAKPFDERMAQLLGITPEVVEHVMKSEESSVKARALPSSDGFV